MVLSVTCKAKIEHLDVQNRSRATPCEIAIGVDGVFFFIISYYLLSLDTFHKPYLKVGKKLTVNLSEAKIQIYKEFLGLGKATIAVKYASGTIVKTDGSKIFKQFQTHILLDECEDPNRLLDFLNTLEKIVSSPGTDLNDI